MIPVYLLALLIVTSAGAYGLCRLRPEFQASFRYGIQKTLETIGVAVVFFAINAGITVVGTLALRSLGLFVSLYIATDYTMIVLSFLQAVVFQHWRYTGTEHKRS